MLAFQYAGHGTYVDVLDGDESEAGNEETKYDEAFCPIDFRGGNLIIDNDLGEIFDQLPDGVSLTAFFDSCHSGDGQRRLQLQPADVANLSAASAPHGRRARFIVPDEQTSRNYRVKRGTPTRAGKRALAREVLFSACKPIEVAYETGGHGDFTVAASLLVVPNANRLTNAEFLVKVREAFSSQPRQNPDFNGARGAKSRIFLGALAGGVGAPAVNLGVGPSVVPGAISGAGSAAIPVAILALLDAAAGLGPEIGAGGIDSTAGSAGPAGVAGSAGSRETDAAARALAAAAFLRAAADFIDG